LISQVELRRRANGGRRDDGGKGAGEREKKIKRRIFCFPLNIAWSNHRAREGGLEKWPESEAKKGRQKEALRETNYRNASKKRSQFGKNVTRGETTLTGAKKKKKNLVSLGKRSEPKKKKSPLVTSGQWKLGSR